MGLVLRAEKLLNNTQEAKLQLGGLLGCRLMLGGVELPSAGTQSCSRAHPARGHPDSPGGP